MSDLLGPVVERYVPFKPWDTPFWIKVWHARCFLDEIGGDDRLAIGWVREDFGGDDE